MSMTLWMARKRRSRHGLNCIRAMLNLLSFLSRFVLGVDLTVVDGNILHFGIINLLTLYISNSSR